MFFFFWTITVAGTVYAVQLGGCTLPSLLQHLSVPADLQQAGIETC